MKCEERKKLSWHQGTLAQSKSTDEAADWSKVICAHGCLSSGNFCIVKSANEENSLALLNEIDF